MTPVTSEKSYAAPEPMWGQEDPNFGLTGGWFYTLITSKAGGPFRGPSAGLRMPPAGHPQARPDLYP